MSSVDWYTPGGVPATGSSGSSAAMRGELALIETALDKLPAFSGNGSKILALNSGATAVTVIAMLDEDNMTSNSNTQPATQQSIKAYVDATVLNESLLYFFGSFGV